MLNDSSTGSLALGGLVGTAVGTAEGCFVGRTVGRSVGLAVGALLGAGVFVGDADGEGVGLGEGTGEGLAEGTGEGLTVGEGVGLGVGLAVGCCALANMNKVIMSITSIITALNMAYYLMQRSRARAFSFLLFTLFLPYGVTLTGTRFAARLCDDNPILFFEMMAS